MHFYAQLDGSGKCTAVTQANGPLVGAQFVELASFDTSFLGRTYSNGAWD